MWRRHLGHSSTNANGHARRHADSGHNCGWSGRNWWLIIGGYCCNLTWGGGPCWGCSWCCCSHAPRTNNGQWGKWEKAQLKQFKINVWAKFWARLASRILSVQLIDRAKHLKLLCHCCCCCLSVGLFTHENANEARDTRDKNNERERETFPFDAHSLTLLADADWDWDRKLTLPWLSLSLPLGAFVSPSLSACRSLSLSLSHSLPWAAADRCLLLLLLLVCLCLWLPSSEHWGLVSMCVCVNWVTIELSFCCQTVVKVQ